MAYQIRHAKETDWKEIQALYATARQFMADHGNPDQWGSQYPPDEMLLRDIAREKLFLIYNECGIHGVFYFAVEEDPTYSEIYDGAWSRSEQYGVIHRIAGDGSGGVLGAAVAFGKQLIKHIRIDTHHDNKVMQKAVIKYGFQRSGIIHLEDGDPRIAYDLLTEE